MVSWKRQAIGFWAAFLAVSLLSLGVGMTSTDGILEEDLSYIFYGTALVAVTVTLCILLVYGALCVGRAESRLGTMESDEARNGLEERASRIWKMTLSPTLQLVFLITITSAAIPSSGWFLSVNHEINTISALEVLLGSIVTIVFSFVVLLTIRRQSLCDTVES